LVKKLEELVSPAFHLCPHHLHHPEKDMWKKGTKRHQKDIDSGLKNDRIEKLQEQENTGAEKSKLFSNRPRPGVTDFLKQYLTISWITTLPPGSKKSSMK